MKRTKNKTEPISPSFFIKVMEHWTTPGVVGAVVGLSLFLLCSGSLGLALGVSAFFTGAIFSSVRFFGSSPEKYKVPKEKFKENAKEQPNVNFKLNSKKQYRSSLRASPSVLRALTSANTGIDSLAFFLCFVYRSVPAMLRRMQPHVEVDHASRLITCVNKIKQDQEWGTDVHAGYLARLFGVHCEGVTVALKARLHSRAKFSTLQVIPGGDWSFNAERKHEYAVELINHGNGHWTTLSGCQPAAGEKDTRDYLDNPGKGGCFFYAFSLALARQMYKHCLSIENIKRSSLYVIWSNNDINMKNPDVVHALYYLGRSENPKLDTKLHKAWSYFQRSLRYLVAHYMSKQLSGEGLLALHAYQDIQKNQGDPVYQDNIIHKLFTESPLYREFNMLYNLNEKTKRDDLCTNIFADILVDVHSSNALTACL